LSGREKARAMVKLPELPRSPGGTSLRPESSQIPAAAANVKPQASLNDAWPSQQQL